MGILPISIAAYRSTQGFVANGVSITFSNCDANPNSYFAVFPNFDKKTPSNYGSGWGRFQYRPVCGGLMDNLKEPTKYLPDGYFMFGEAHFGGCGCYAQTDAEEKTVVGVAIGYE